MATKFVCRFCLAPIVACPEGEGCLFAHCHGWVHQDTGAHEGHPHNPHTAAQPAVA